MGGIRNAGLSLSICLDRVGLFYHGVTDAAVLCRMRRDLVRMQQDLVQTRAFLHWRRSPWVLAASMMQPLTFRWIQ